ncbi:MAG: hypothetical protein J6U43_04650, partial [Bacteroidales bacterium]|nr:hypothetical protein [Bacteroidales bacterium]
TVPVVDDEPLFTINVHEDKLSAYSVVFDIIPADKSKMYYYNITSKARVSEIDIKAIKKEKLEAAEKAATLYGTTPEEELAQMLMTGDLLNFTSADGYRPEYEFCIYAFYWDATSQDEIYTCDFTTLAVQESSESVQLSATTDVHSMSVDVQPSSGVTEYWYYFDERAKAEAMLAGLEDQNAFMSYYAMNVGIRKEVAETIEHKGLKPATEYMVMVMAIDNKLNRFVASEVFTTKEENVVERVESELFEALLGEWDGMQTVTDLYNEPRNTYFTVNIVSSMPDVDYDYRAMNQLVATVDGWCSQPFYSVTDLRAYEEVEFPEEKWGPKWILNIAEGDKVTIDGKANTSLFGWHFVGNCFMLNAKYDGSKIYTDTDFEVIVSDDRNTIRITSPDGMSGVGPSMCYEYDGCGWMALYYGVGEILLTRKK